jgi:hypothetical protein
MCCFVRRWLGLLFLLICVVPSLDGVMHGSMMSIGGQVRDQPIPHPLLPFGHTIFVAPQNSGKTTVILNFFLNEALLLLFFAYYHKIFFVSIHATEDTRSGYELLMARNYHGRFVFIDHMDAENWNSQIKAQAHDTKRNLFICDDMCKNLTLMRLLAEKIISCNQLPDLVDLWIVSQGWMDIPEPIRDNIDFAIFMRSAVAKFGAKFIGTTATRTAVVRYKDAKSYPPSAMLRLFEHCLQGIHDFLLVGLCNRMLDADRQQTYFVNFTHRIDARPRGQRTGLSHQPRDPILLPADRRIDVPVEADGQVLPLRAYCHEHPLPPPPPAIDVREVTGLYEDGACFRVFCRLYPDREAEALASFADDSAEDATAPAPAPAPTAPAPAPAPTAPAPAPASTALEQMLLQHQQQMMQMQMRMDRQQQQMRQMQMPLQPPMQMRMDRQQQQMQQMQMPLQPPPSPVAAAPVATVTATAFAAAPVAAPVAALVAAFATAPVAAFAPAPVAAAG